MSQQISSFEAPVSAPVLGLSHSVKKVVRMLPESEPVIAAAIVNGLLQIHPEYAGYKAQKMHIPEDFGGRQMPVMEWLQEVDQQYDSERVKKLDGQLVILGLSRLDPDLERHLAENDFLETLRKEYKPPVKSLLSLLGEELWSYKPSPTRHPTEETAEESDQVLPADFETDRSYLHSDNPAVEDELNRKPFAAALALHLRYIRLQMTNSDPDHANIPEERANSAADQSFLLHVYGPWGSGKSSLLNFLRAKLERPLDNDRYPDIDTHEWVVVDFNAWQHQRIDPPWWALIDSVFRQARERLWRIDKRQAIKLWGKECLWRFGTAATPRLLAVIIAALLVVGLLLLVSMAMTPASEESNTSNLAETMKTMNVIIALLVLIVGVGYSISRSLLPGTARAAQSFSEMTRNPMSRITRHFADLVDWINYPVAVFVDDLDRCEAEYVVEFLERVQTLFRGAPVVYIVAADMRWLRTSYKNVYEVFTSTVREPGHPLGYLFMEKIFQLSVPIPDILASYKDAYWTQLVEGAQAEDGQELDLEELHQEAQQKFRGLWSDQAILAEVNRYQGTKREQVYRAEAVKRLVAPEVQVATEHRLRKYIDLLGSNPRAMKRMVNNYVIQQQLATLTGIAVEPDTLPLWTILSMRWPSFSEYLREHPEAVGHIGQPGKTTLDPIPKELHDLFRDREVQKVVTGEGAAGPLDEATLHQCARLSS